MSTTIAPPSVPARPGWIKVLLWMQVLLAVAAVAVWAVAVKKGKPLFAAERDLRQQIVRDQRELAATRADLPQSRQKLSHAREAITFVTQGINRFHEGDYAGAVRNYDLALGRLGPDSFVLDLRGYALFKAHLYPEAVKTLKESLRLDPANEYAMLDLIKA